MSEQNSGGNSNDSIWLMLLVLCIFMAIFYFYGNQIASVFLIIKKIEYYMIKFTGMELLFSGAWNKNVVPALEMFETVNKTIESGKKVSMKQLSIIGSGIGYFSRWYYVAICAVVSYMVYKRIPSQRFKNKYSMKTLVKSEQKLWPAIAPVVNLDLVSEPIHEGKWAMAMRPVDFAKKYGLLDEENKLIRYKAEKLFAAQLGRLWEGHKKLNAYERALFAAFVAQACGDLKGAKEGLDLLSISMANNKPDYSWVSGLIEKHAKEEKIQKIIASHAYVFTVMAALLKEARTFGVLASAQFIWLRPKNRTLWYTLNGVGRRVSYAEVAGIFAHWIAEDIAGKALERPFVVKAVDGLEIAISEVKFDGD